MFVVDVDCGDQINDLAETALIESGAGVVLVEDALERFVLALKRGHGVVDKRADLGVLGLLLDVVPACFERHPRDILCEVFVLILRVGVLVGAERGVLLEEGVGDVLEEDQAEDNVLVLGGVHVAAELIADLPKAVFEAEIGGVGGGLGHESLPRQTFRFAFSPSPHVIRWSIVSR